MTQPPHDEPTATSPAELREQVEQTRHELGDTVQALADKSDVKARAQDKAAALKEQATAKTAELSEQTKAKAAQAAQMLQDKLPGPLKDKAALAAQQVKTQTAQAEQLWQDKAPAPVRDRRSPLLAAGAALIIACVLLRRTKK